MEVLKAHQRKLKIKKNDTVEIIAGNDRGLRGKVLRADPKTRRLVVEGANIRKKHQRARQRNNTALQASIVQFEAPIHISNVMLVCPRCDKASRVSLKREEGKRPVRVCKKCGEDID